MPSPPANLVACFIGVLIGTVVGVLPGIGPIGAMGLLIPSTLALSPTSALIMLAGIYYGSMYGGSTTSILVRVPGEAASVVTALESYEMARRGRAGAAQGLRRPRAPHRRPRPGPVHGEYLPPDAARRERSRRTTSFRTHGDFA